MYFSSLEKEENVLKTMTGCKRVWMMVLVVMMALAMISSLAFAAGDADDVLFDIGSNNAAFTGVWHTVTAPTAYGGTARYIACSKSSIVGHEAVFDSSALGITVNSTSEYVVYVHWSAFSGPTTTAHYRIYDGSTAASPAGECTVNQTGNPGEWVYCDTVTLSQGNSAVIKLGDDCQSKNVSANAVRFLKLSATQGSSGTTGPQGPKGDTGATGAAGPAGSQGIQGVAGPAGPAGPQGPAGAAGTGSGTGVAGPAGPVGPAGPAGSQGIQGVAGPQGVAGAAGATGPAGAVGPQGPKGNTGATGPAGPQGPAGAAAGDPTGILGSWVTVTGTSQQAVPNTGYLTMNSSPTTVTLPLTSGLTLGDIIRVSGVGSGGWQIAPNSGQSILYSGISLSYLGMWVRQAAAGADNWSAIASSADGTKLVVVVAGGYISTSTDSGHTWTQQILVGTGNWRSVASSADGTKLAVAPSNGHISTSTDSGHTWTQQAGSPITGWSSIASSADGTKLVAASGAGSIYTSTDSGHTWNLQSGSGNYVASSADGTKLVAASFGGFVSTSTDSGHTWTQQTALGGQDWTGVACSSDGTKIVAVAGYIGYLYTSADSGTTWVPQTGAGKRNWSAVVCSSDCSRILAVSDSLLTSLDSGVTWAQQSIGVTGIFAVASSADGTKLVAALEGGNIYTAVASSVLTSGSISGSQYAAVELQHIGNGQFIPLSSIGAITTH